MQFLPVAHDIMQCINYFIAMLRESDKDGHARKMSGDSWTG